MKDIFALMGVIFTFILCEFLIGMFIIFIQEKIRILRRRYQYKHRFDKPPVAKCYCKDCEYRSKYEECHILGGTLKVADNWFCWRANPRE